MKKILKYFIVSIITVIAKCALFIHKPFVIAIVGSVGKTTTKDAVFAMVSKFKNARTGQKSYNSEVGVPLAILGLENPWGSFLGWLVAIIKGIWNATSPRFPKYLVLEVGADHPGDVRQIANWLKVDIVVLTRWGETPVHVQYFDSPKALKDEDAKIIDALKSESGIIVYNNDDEDAVNYAKKWHGTTYSYGKGSIKDESEGHAMVRFESHITATEKLPKTAINIADNIDATLFAVPALGEQFGYPLSVSWAVALVMNLEDRQKMVEALNDFIPPPGRMNVLEGVNDSLLVDDTYNSSPIALMSAIEAVTLLRSKRENDQIRNSPRLIAVLGDMLELGEYAEEEHKKMGTILFDRAFDLVFCVGELARLFGESAIKAGMAEDCVFYFEDSNIASQEVGKYVAKDDIVLLKGSQASRIEKITKALMTNKEEARNKLVRQEAVWQNR